MEMNTNGVVASNYTKDYNNKVKNTTANSRTIGEPQLSEEAQKYYDQLKKKFSNYDFVLVSKDQIEYAKANIGKYAGGAKTAVLIDEEKIERMATDEEYRKKYEGILSGAANQIAQVKSGIEKSGANVKGFGIMVNDDGTTTLFATLKKSASDQKARIEKKQEEKKAEKKAEEKKAKRKKAEEEGKEETVTLKANSVEELLQKISDHLYNERSNTIKTESEMMVGQSIDFKG